MSAGNTPPPPAGPSRPGSISALLEELAQAPEVQPGTAVAPGMVLGGRFEVLRELGRGGFGVVFEARDRELGRLVAVKVVRPRRGADPGMLRAEAEAAAALHHPNIVTLHDVGSAGSEGWLVLELLRGETLEDRMRRGPVAPAEALRIATEVARGLAHAHRAGVLHRDLKPSNVFLCDDGAVKILDFGLSRIFGSGSGPDGGTPAYMAPEQWRREEEDERTDVFALGVILHEMLSGQRPFAVESGRSTALDDGPPPELPAASAPRAVRALVRRALSRAPGERPRDGTALLESLLERRGLGGSRRRRGALLAAAAVVVLALAGLAGMRAMRDRDLAPGQRIPVAVADFQNATSDPELNGLSGMLTTSLEQSRRLTVLTRSRLVDLIRQTGKEVPERIDESLAREVGKAAGVKALLLATVHRFDDLYAIEMRALDPATDEYLFTLKESGRGKASVPGMIDRLSAQTRERLRERPADLAARRSVAEVTTSDLAAYEHYFRARQALDVRRFPDARRELDAALTVDPQFALAHYQRAVLDSWTVKRGMSDERSLRGVQAHIDSAVRLADRLPDRERIALMAWKATWEQRNREALALRDEAAERWPQDKESVFWAGDIRFHTGDTVGALPYFSRALQLDPDYVLAEEHTIIAALALGRAQVAHDLARAWADRSRTPEAYRFLATSLLALDRPDDARVALGRAGAQDGRTWPPLELARYLALHGRAPEAEREARRFLASLPPEPASPSGQPPEADPSAESKSNPRVAGTIVVAEMLLAQGRFREARQLLDGLEAAGARPQVRASALIGLATATRSPGDLRAAVDAVQGLPPDHRDPLRLSLATARALAGDPAGAEAMAGAVFSGPEASSFPPHVRPNFEAIVAWQKGDLDAAAARLAGAADIPYAEGRYAALAVLGAVELGRGRDEAAIAAMEQARAMGFVPGNGGAIVVAPMLLQGLATAYERTGDRARARERVDEYLRLRERADSDAPGLAEVKALKKRLAPRTAQATQR